MIGVMDRRFCSEDDRPFCREIGCDVEVHALGMHCPAHEWAINRWLAKSREILATLKREAENKNP